MRRALSQCRVEQLERMMLSSRIVWVAGLFRPRHDAAKILQTDGSRRDLGVRAMRAAPPTRGG